MRGRALIKFLMDFGGRSLEGRSLKEIRHFWFTTDLVIYRDTIVSDSNDILAIEVRVSRGRFLATQNELIYPDTLSPRSPHAEIFNMASFDYCALTMQ